MKFLLLFFIFSPFFLCSCNTKQAEDPLEKKLSENEVKEDLGVFRNVLESAHPSLALYQGKEKVEQLFDSVYNSFTGSSSLRDLYNSLYFIANETGCSHTDLFLPGHIYDTLQNRKYFFPYPVLWVDNKLLVNVTGYDLPEGTEILSINGISAGRLLHDLSSYNSIEGFHRPGQIKMASKDLSFQYYLKWGTQQKFELKIIDTSGRRKTITEEPIDYAEWNVRNDSYKYYFDGMEVDYDLAINNEKNYALLRLPTFDFDNYQKRVAFEHFCSNTFELLEKKKNITKLIIDLRENKGGKLSSAFLLFSYLTPKPFKGFDYVFSKIKRIPYPEYLDPFFSEQDKDDINYDLKNEFGRKNNGNYYYADSLIERWEPGDHLFNGNVFVITNPATVSSGSYFAVMVKYSGVGKIVGEETAGGSHSGNGFQTLKYILPGSSFQLVFPYAHIIYTVKEKKNIGRGVIPDHIVPDTYDAFKNNEDNQLSYILDSLN